MTDESFKSQAPGSKGSWSQFDAGFVFCLAQPRCLKRRDSTKVPVFHWDDPDGLMEIDSPDGPAFRAALPGFIDDGFGIITVVVHGKPLPVERIDALKTEAQRELAVRPLLGPEMDRDIIDVEAQEVAKKSLPSPRGEPWRDEAEIAVAPVKIAADTPCAIRRPPR